MNENELSPKRQKILELLERIPKVGLSSDDAQFQELTGKSTRELTKWWDEHPVGTPNSSLTTCNAFVGKIAQLVGAKNGSWLAMGLLQLDWAERDVPGCWVSLAEWHRTGRAPQRGDFYAKPYFNKKGEKQAFGHVGIIYDLNYIFYNSVDSGQGGRAAGKDYIKWSDWKLWTTAEHMTGWVDIDAYFAGP